MLKLEAAVSTKGNVRCVTIIFAFAIYWWVDYFLPFLSIETFIGTGKKKKVFRNQLKLQPQKINTPTMFGSIVFSRFSKAAMQKSSIESNKKSHIYLYRIKQFYWGLANGCSGLWASLQLNVSAFLRCCGGICFLFVPHSVVPARCLRSRRTAVNPGVCVFVRTCVCGLLATLQSMETLWFLPRLRSRGHSNRSAAEKNKTYTLQTQSREMLSLEKKLLGFLLTNFHSVEMVYPKSSMPREICFKRRRNL